MSGGAKAARGAIGKAAFPVLSATMGVAGGIVLGRNVLQRKGRTLGVPVPVPKKKGIDLNGLGQQVGEAGRQFAKLAQEVRAVREKAEQVGRAIS